MTQQQMLISAILAFTMLLFTWGRWRYDMVAMLALILAVLTGVVSSNNAFVGFGHPAVVTVAAVLIISHALKNAGAVDVIASQLSRLTKHPILHIASLTVVVTVASAFMNNVGALALMLPVAMASAQERDRSPALLLMPLAFGSILGGMTTLIGTPPNIIIASIRAEVSGTPFSMFDYSPVGSLVALAGVLFVTLIGWRLIPKERLNHNVPEKLFEINHYITEAKIPADSHLIGTPLDELEGFDSESVEVIGVAGARRYAREVREGYKLVAGDILLIRADPVELKPLLENHKLELLTSATHSFKHPGPHNEIMLEGVVHRNSPMIGRGVEYLRRKTSRTVALVGVARDGKPVRRRLKRMDFKAGDILLLLGNASHIDEQLVELGLWPLAQRSIDLHRARRVGLAIAIFAFAITLGVAGIVSLPIAFILAIMAYVVTGILSVRQIYDEIDWRVIVLLAALIPVGRALETTGTTELLASSMTAWTTSLPTAMVLGLILVITMFLSDIINNAATALVMGPLAVAIANTLGVHTDPFLMAVAVGASCAFLTPIGHQSNTLVMSPGGYRFGDYWRMGLPLEILIVVISVPMILWVWPL